MVKKRKEKEKESFFKKTSPIPTWLAILVAIFMISSVALNFYQFMYDRPTNRVIISEGPTADPHDDLSLPYTSKVKLSFDGRYSLYYAEWKIQNKLGKAAGFEEIGGCNKLGSLTSSSAEQELECKINFRDEGEYKVIISVYYTTTELNLQDSKEKIDWLLENGERSYPSWKYAVYVNQRDKK